MVAEVTEVSCFSWVKLLTVLAIKFFSAELHNDTSQRKFWMMLLCQTEVTSFSLATVPCCLVLKTGSKFREVLLNITGWLEHLNNCLSVLAHFCCHPNTFSLTIYMRQWQGKGFKQLAMTGTPKLLSTRPKDTALLAVFQVHSVSKPIKTRRTTSHTHSQVSPVNTQLLSGSSRAPHVSNFMRFQKEEKHILDFNWNS